MDSLKNNIGLPTQLPSDLYGVTLLYTVTRVKGCYRKERYYRPLKNATVHTGSIQTSVAITCVHNSGLRLSRPLQV